jgi:uncharacterized protein
MPRMVEVIIDSVRVSLTNQQRIVILQEVDAERYLPIWIGPYEAEAITIALQEIEVARPQTHDLLKNMLQALNGRLIRVEVHNLREDVFYGNLVIEVNDRTINLDSRPSDALALAVRAHVPILVSSEVLDLAGIVPEQDTQLHTGPTQPSTDQVTDKIINEERLSVFEDFLEKFDLDDLSNSGKNEPGDEDNNDEENDEPGNKVV